jgi:hypothetical protein
LNVIEAVFGGMKRAVIHGSDYQSVNEKKSALSIHFAERNGFFKDDPKRAGTKIWDIDFFRYLEPAYQVRLEPGFGPDALHAFVADPNHFRHRPELQCVAFGGISPAVLDSNLRFTTADSGFLPGGRVL